MPEMLEDIPTQGGGSSELARGRGQEDLHCCTAALLRVPTGLIISRFTQNSDFGKISQK